MYKFIDHNLERHYKPGATVTLPTHFLNVSSFSTDYCADLKPKLLAFSGQKSTVYDSESVTSNFQINPQFRISSMTDISAELRSELDARIDFVVEHHTKHLIGPLTGLIEGSQVLRYDGENSGHFTMHSDNAFIDANNIFQHTNPNRLITTVTILNDDYEGGELILGFMSSDNAGLLKLKPQAGTTIIFPSDMRYPHQVMPVTKGTRFSMVRWYGAA